MPDNKKHHFVPRFYLRRFSPNGKCVSLYNIQLGKLIKNAPLKGQCYKDYFYGEDQKFEKLLSNIEGEASNVLKRLVTEPYSNRDHMAVVLYMATQHGRTAYTVSALNEITQWLAAQVGEEGLKNLGTTAQEVKENEKDTPRLSVRNSFLLHFLLFDLEMKVVRVTKGSLITSDTPVVHYNQLFESERYLSNQGATSKGLQVFLPVDSETLIVLYDKDVYSVGGRGSSTIINATASDIEQINGLQIVSADENVYFEDPSTPIPQLVSKYRKFRRKRKSRFSIHPGEITEEGFSQILATSNEDIRTNLQLSFIRTVKLARSWKVEFLKHKTRPAATPRNPVLTEAHQIFTKEILPKGLASAIDFPAWCLDNFGYFPYIKERDFRERSR